MRMWVAPFIMAFTATPGAAREVTVPVDKGWKHAASGVTLRQPLAGLVRNKLDDSTDGEFDVSANFRSVDGRFGATIFIFSSPLPDAGIWFQRAVAQIADSGTYGTATPISAPLPLVLPGRASPSGFRQTFTVAKRLKGTSVALAQLGTWLVAVRVSSDSADAAETDAEMTTLLSAIGWPAAIPATSAPAMPAPCPDALAFKKATMIRPTGADILLSAILPIAAADAAAKGEAKEDVQPLCRDPASTPAWGVYRRGNDRSGYTLALGDAGRILSVTPNLMALSGGSKAKISVTLGNVDGRSMVYPSFDALPRPKQAAAVLKEHALSVVKGKTVTLDANAMKN